MAHRIRIAIDPQLRTTHGPEICWIWRLLLSSVGLPWQEVPVDQGEVDVAYVIDPGQTSGCKLVIRAEPPWWADRSGLELDSVARSGAWQHPVYRQEEWSGRALERQGTPLILDRDLVFDLFWLLTGQAEPHQEADQHGNLSTLWSADLRREVLQGGLASAMICSLESRLAELGLLEGCTPRWPDGKKSAACITHDVDYPEVVRWLEPLRVLQRGGLGAWMDSIRVLTGRKDNWHFESWVDLERELQTPSAFYFCARQGSLVERLRGLPDPFYDVTSGRFRDLFRRLSESQTEIGLHASYEAYASEATFAAEKSRLEEASGQSVRGNRHHYWHMSPGDPETTLRLHERVGFDYDCSLTHDRFLGWRRALSWPFFPFHQAERREIRTLQIPTGWMDDQLFGYREHNPGSGEDLLAGLARTAAAQGGCLMINIHDYVFDDDLYPGWCSSLRELWTGSVDRSTTWTPTPVDLADHWTGRHRKLLAESEGLEGEA